VPRGVCLRSPHPGCYATVLPLQSPLASGLTYKRSFKLCFQFDLLVVAYLQQWFRTYQILRELTKLLLWQFVISGSAQLMCYQCRFLKTRNPSENISTACVEPAGEELLQLCAEDETYCRTLSRVITNRKWCLLISVFLRVQLGDLCKGYKIWRFLKFNCSIY